MSTVIENGNWLALVLRLAAKAEHVGTIFLVVLHMQHAAIPMYALLIFDGACHAFLAAVKAV